MDWLDGIAGPGYSAAILWTFAALILLLIVLIIIKLVRSLTFGTFVAGGRNRKARLAVMDATAVDSNRRLVLVRRDDIEHLLLIGGASDIVVERDIRLSQRRPVLSGDSHDPAPRAQPHEQPAARPVPLRTTSPAPRPAPAIARPAPAPAPRQAQAPRVEPPSVPPAAPIPERNTRPAPVLAHVSPLPARQRPEANTRDKIDDELMKELEVSLGETSVGSSSKSSEASLDDEMTKLLGELSSQKR